MAVARNIPEIVMYTGDRRPVITATLYESSGAVFNLTGATGIECYIYLEGNTVASNSNPSGSILLAAAGTISYTLSEAFTEPGTYMAQFRIIWPSSVYQHTGKFRLRVEKGLV